MNLRKSRRSYLITFNEILSLLGLMLGFDIYLMVLLFFTKLKVNRSNTPKEMFAIGFRQFTF